MTADEIKRLIDEKQGRLGQLRDDLIKAQEELEQLRYDLVTATHGIKIGDVVKSEDQILRVTRMEYWSHTKPWLYGNLMRKDGTFGVGERRLRSNNWTVCNTL